MASRILLVEDNKDIREITTFLLERWGYCVTTATNGREGLAIFLEGQIDLIVTDIFMPEMDGNKFIAQLVNYGDLPPIIALSYNILDIAQNSAITVSETKPVVSERLRQIVAEALKLKKKT